MIIMGCKLLTEFNILKIIWVNDRYQSGLIVPSQWASTSPNWWYFIILFMTGVDVLVIILVKDGEQLAPGYVRPRWNFWKKRVNYLQNYINESG